MTGKFPLSAVAALAAGVLFTAGCTGSDPAPTSTSPDPMAPVGELRLVAFDSCQDTMDQLRKAAKEYVGPYGLNGPAVPFAAEAATTRTRAGGPEAAMAADASAEKAAAPAAPGTDNSGGAYSGTNTHEAGVDEPDLVKTDGRRIVTVNKGVLSVVDPATRRVTGQLDLATSGDGTGRWVNADASLLLSGDHALVLLPGWQVFTGIRAGVTDDVDGLDIAVSPAQPRAVAGPTLLLVDLSSAPRLLGSYRVDGSLVDARQVGTTARIVVRSAPRLEFPNSLPAGKSLSDAQRLKANKEVIDKAGADEWLPRYEVTAGGHTEQGRVECGQVSHSAKYSATSMLTLLTFDLGASTLGNGDPVTVVADGETVYSNGQSLYVASNQQWLLRPMPAQGSAPASQDQVTDIYKFDASGSGRPRYAASGSVPGYLINQYAMSEWDGHLRIATTNDKSSDSSVYTLRQDGSRLVRVGKVGGLGKGERIYAVRFVGSTGYVVTFRQTDPLYTVDLRNPAKPTVAGELKITGYSAYLHPAGDGRLIGIGQEASDQGRVQGTQVSLFDVSDLAKPDRLAQYHVKYGNSEAEFDPHAFLYWPSDRLMVVPLTAYRQASSATKVAQSGGALVLKVGDDTLTERGMVTQQDSAGDLVRRSLVVNGILWTVSAEGLQANDLSTLDKLGWIPLS